MAAADIHSASPAKKEIIIHLFPGPALRVAISGVQIEGVKPWKERKLFEGGIFMKFGTRLLAIAFLLFSAFVPSRSALVNEMDIAQVRAAIEAGNLKFGEAVRKGDAAAIAALYSEDATLMPPDSDPIQGKEAIQAYFSGGVQMGVKDAVLTTLSVSGAGDYAYEIGKVLMIVQPPGQAAVQRTGKYVVVWKKAASGSWQLHVDIWN